MKTEFKQWHQILELAVRQAGKPAVYISNNLDWKKKKDEEAWEFVISELASFYGVAIDCHPTESPEYYNMRTNLTIGGLFFFDNPEEQYKFYRIFEQPLTDSSAIYACTFNVDGECETENT